MLQQLQRFTQYYYYNYYNYYYYYYYYQNNLNNGDADVLVHHDKDEADFIGLSKLMKHPSVIMYLFPHRKAFRRKTTSNTTITISTDAPTDQYSPPPRSLVTKQFYTLLWSMDSFT